MKGDRCLHTVSTRLVAEIKKFRAKEAGALRKGAEWLYATHEGRTILLEANLLSNLTCDIARSQPSRLGTYATPCHSR